MRVGEEFFLRSLFSDRPLHFYVDTTIFARYCKARFVVVVIARGVAPWKFKEPLKTSRDAEGLIYPASSCSRKRASRMAFGTHGL
jgi:hypothetical protein